MYFLWQVAIGRDFQKEWNLWVCYLKNGGSYEQNRLSKGIKTGREKTKLTEITRVSAFGTMG